MKPLPVWFERTENLAVAAAVVVAFVSLHFSWWWLPALFLAFDASMVGYLAGNRAGAVCYNLAHAYVVPAALLLSYVASGTRWCAFVGLLWAFHIAGDRVLGYGLKFTSSFHDTHLGTIGKQRLPRDLAKPCLSLKLPRTAHEGYGAGDCQCPEGAVPRDQRRARA